MIKRFFCLVSVSMQSAMAFRLAFVFNLFTPLLLLAGQYILWTALYAQQGGATIGNFSKEMMYTYILLSFLISNILSWKSENDLSRKIVSGSIVTECVRPFSFLGQNLADMTGAAVLQGLVNFIFVLIIFLIFRSSMITAPPLNIIFSAASLVLGILIRMLLISIVSLLCFTTTSHLGISWTRGVVTEFFSGAVIPISLFPAVLGTFAYYTPFPLMLNIPITIYLGQSTYYPLHLVFALQIFWIVLLALLQTLCWKRIRRNIIIAGG